MLVLNTLSEWVMSHGILLGVFTPSTGVVDVQEEVYSMVWRDVDINVHYINGECTDIYKIN